MTEAARTVAEQAEAAGRPFVLLTQDDCPQCQRLKAMLDRPLRGQFSDRIRTVHRQEMPETFAALAERHGVRSTPALLHRGSGTLARNLDSVSEVRVFLEQAER